MEHTMSDESYKEVYIFIALEANLLWYKQVIAKLSLLLLLVRALRHLLGYILRFFDMKSLKLLVWAD